MKIILRKTQKEGLLISSIDLFGLTKKENLYRSLKSICERVEEFEMREISKTLCKKKNFASYKKWESCTHKPKNRRPLTIL